MEIQPEFPYLDMGERALPVLASLGGAEVVQLHRAGAGGVEFAALGKARSMLDRERLVDLFTWVCPDNWQRLRVLVRFLAYHARRSSTYRGGADILVHGLSNTFPDFGKGGSNDLRCLLVRMAWLAAPAHLKGHLAMRRGSSGDLLLRAGWMPPASIPWDELNPLTAEELAVPMMPL